MCLEHPPFLLAAGGAVVGVSGLPQDAAAERGGCRVDGVGGGPRGVRGGGRVGVGQGADLRAGMVGGAGGVLPQRVALAKVAAERVRFRFVDARLPAGEGSVRLQLAEQVAQCRRTGPADADPPARVLADEPPAGRGLVAPKVAEGWGDDSRHGSFG